jgi:hypothetical protein
MLKALILGFASVIGMANCTNKVDIDPNQLNESCSSPPEPVRFVLLDKQGKNLAAGNNAPITVSFEENGQIKTIPCIIGKLQRIGSDTTRKYSGVGIGCDLGGYSVRQSNAVKTFKVMVGNQQAGIIYYDLQKNSLASKADCYTVNSFQFENLAVSIDNTVIPFMAVLKSNL